MQELHSQFTPFLGVRFVLYGFDHISEREVRSKLVSGGGIDGGKYGDNCTHVIVDKIVYDDPVCVNARNDRKIVITRLWVEHSFDLGIPADTTIIMYRPLRALNGIPGAKGLIMCLTGYQRHFRDDVMIMVGLMGAQFSKPLVANKVTHLICYKFEGEKYELAHRMKTIKLVNHRWLEDCLKEWKLLPEDNYNKSGYELEMMEAEAKDSEEDVEDGTLNQLSCENAKSPGNLRLGTPRSSELHKSTAEPKLSHSLGDPEAMPSAINAKGILIPGRENGADYETGNNRVGVHEMSGSEVAGSLRDCTVKEFSNLQETTPNSLKLDKGFASISRSSDRPFISDSRFSAVSYSRKTPRRSSSSLFSEELSNERGSPKMPSTKYNSSSFSPTKLGKDFESSRGIPQKQSGIIYEEASSGKKQKTDISCFSRKSPAKMSYDAKACVMGSPSINCSQGSGPKSSVVGSSTINNHSPSGNHEHSLHGISTNAAPNFLNNTLAVKSSEVKKASLPHNVSSETRSEELGDSNFVSNRDSGDSTLEYHKQMENEPGGAQSSLQVDEVAPAFNRKIETEKSLGGHGNSSTKPVKKKSVVKKTLGSRPNLKSSANQKGSIYSNKVPAQNDPKLFPPLGEASTEHEKLFDWNERDVSDVAVNVQAVDIQINTASNKVDSMDDETEAPNENNRLDNVCGDPIDLACISLNQDNDKLMKSEEAQLAAQKSAYKQDDVEKNVAEEQKETFSCEKGQRKGENERKKQPSGRTKKKAVPMVTGKADSKSGLDLKKNCGVKNVKEKSLQKDEDNPCPVGQTKSRKLSGKRPKSSTEAEKENQIVIEGDVNVNSCIKDAERNTVKSGGTAKEINQNTRKTKNSPVPVRAVSKNIKTEPVCYILSGHRLQRKEYQKIIRRLQGKYCRDSHQWSYQATHFISSDPLRRTEKFFAAAASGRWILKADFLTACSQTGKFVAEEPYEWHKTGLSEDGAINLEAPRKWRLLRERTGHGAFYGMRIIVYGECIAPPLDTLKRVVKAGDGTILATSPPYTRFLTSGVDYAVVSPGMPHVDLWVQEFLKHEIPCIVADYLVEYVCKPGYSLEKHVLYNTRTWAEKSFSNLLSRAEEVVEDAIPGFPVDSDGSSDIACQVCHSHGRGDVLLICGDEGGSVGCGVGMHIDCCDPPLEGIPEEDWFCPKCSGNKTSRNPPKRKKGSSSAKTK